jgi:putative ABC transport system permease protein
MRLAFKSFKREKGKTLLVIASVVIAIALCVSMMIAITSIKEQYRALADEQSSSADLVLTSYYEEKISDAELEAAGSKEKIQEAIKFYSTEGYYQISGKDYAQLSLLAVDYELEEKYGGLKLLSGRFGKANTECVITDVMAEQYGLKAGDSLGIISKAKAFSYIITGIVSDNGIAAGNLGRCILTDVNTFDEYGEITYKIVLKDGVSVPDCKKRMEEELGGKYRIDYPEGKAEEFISSMETLFDGMMGFAVLAIILSSLFISVVLRDYVMNMRKTFAIIKALGGTRKDIIKTVLDRVVLIAVVGILIGTTLGVFLSQSLVAFLGTRLDSGSQEIQTAYNIPLIIAILIFSFLLMLAVSLPQAVRGAKEGVLEGLGTYREGRAEKRRGMTGYIILLFIGIAGTVLGNNDNLKLVSIILLIFAAIILLSKVLFTFIPVFSYQLLKGMAPLTAMLSKNSLFREKRKTINMIMLFSTVLAFSLGIYFAVTGIVQSISNVANTMYYGDAVIESDIGIQDSLFQSVKQVEGVKNVEKNYVKYTDIEGVEVKVRGIYTDNTAFGLSQKLLERMEQEDTVIASKGLLKRLKLTVGDSISIGTSKGTKSYRIIGSIKSMEHDGKLLLLSESKFLQLYQDYTVNSLIVFCDKVSAKQLIQNLRTEINDNTVLIKSIEEGRTDYVSSNSGLIYLFYLLIGILLFAGALIMVNTVTLIIKNNEYSHMIEKTLGLTKRSLVLPYIFTGSVAGLISGITGGGTGVLVGLAFIHMMNQSQIYSIKADFNPLTILLFIVVSIVITIASSGVAVLINYRNAFRHTLAQE